MNSDSDFHIARWTIATRQLQGVLYRAALLGAARLHYIRATYKVDKWISCALLVPLDSELPATLWRDADPVRRDALQWDRQPLEQAGFAGVWPRT